MFDSLPSSASTASDAGASSARTGGASRPPSSSGHAHGQPAIEIFTSFHALVDALADESDRSKTAGKRTTEAAGAATDVPSKDAKTDGDDRVVMPVDIAALLLPNLVAPKGNAIAGAKAQGEGAGTESGDAHDLALLLLGAKGASGDSLNAIANGIGVDDASDRAAGFPLKALAIAASQPGNDPDGAALAQAVIQRLLAAATAGPQKLAGELMGQAGARSQTAVDDLIRQVVAQADRPSSNVTPAARFIAPHDITASSAPSFAAEVVASTSSLLEPPSTSTADQIVQAIRLQWARGGGEAQIRLEPQHFGDLTVSVRVDQGQVIARLQADTPVIREWLQANQQLLRQGLAEHNLTLSRLEVSEPNTESRFGTSRDGQDKESRDGKPARPPESTDDGETFEVVV